MVKKKNKQSLASDMDMALMASSEIYVMLNNRTDREARPDKPTASNHFDSMNIKHADDCTFQHFNFDLKLKFEMAAK